MLKRQKGSECLNCGQDIGDSNYCSNCGQVNDTRRLTFIELIGESLSNFFAVDGRIFRTLRDVLIKPGKVATNFRLGKRMRYMNPVRFYFLASILLITSIQLNRDANLVNSNIDQESISRLKTLSDEERESAIQKAEDKLNKFDDPSIVIRFSAMSDYLMVKPESSKEELYNRLKLEPGFWNDFAFEQAQKTEAGTFESGIHILGLAEGMVGYATEDGMVTSEMASAVEAAAAEIVSGSMEVADWSQE